MAKTAPPEPELSPGEQLSDQTSDRREDSGKSLEPQRNLINTSFKSSVLFYSVVSLVYTLEPPRCPLTPPRYSSLSSSEPAHQPPPLQLQPWDDPYLGSVFMIFVALIFVTFGYLRTLLLAVPRIILICNCDASVAVVDSMITIIISSGVVCLSNHFWSHINVDFAEYCVTLCEPISCVLWTLSANGKHCCVFVS